MMSDSNEIYLKLMPGKQLPPNRTFEQILNHYQVEKALALKLKKATREERKKIYETMYDDLFRQVPDHPRLSRIRNPKIIEAVHLRKLRLIRKVVNESTVFVEFGPGDCRLALEVAKHAKSVYAVDISDQKGHLVDIPDNFEIVVYNGYDLDIAENFADVVFSDQLIEHLHPEDTALHFELVKKILKPQGVYLFRTPHRFSGPHDVSQFFSDQPEGFHLKEWTYRELGKLFQNLQYSSWSGYRYVKGVPIKLPYIYFTTIEYIAERLPRRLKRTAIQYLFSMLIVEVAK